MGTTLSKFRSLFENELFLFINQFFEASVVEKAKRNHSAHELASIMASNEFARSIKQNYDFSGRFPTVDSKLVYLFHDLRTVLRTWTHLKETLRIKIFLDHLTELIYKQAGENTQNTKTLSSLIQSLLNEALYRESKGDVTLPSEELELIQKCSQIKSAVFSLNSLAGERSKSEVATAYKKVLDEIRSLSQAADEITIDLNEYWVNLFIFMTYRIKEKTPHAVLYSLIAKKILT